MRICLSPISATRHSDRIEYYKGFCEYFGISPGPDDTLKCEIMRAFDASSSAATGEYWEWAEWLNNCRLVTYQSAFSIFDDPKHPDAPYCGCMHMAR
mmetsp:Transcript_20360/g.17044  ORF Transcript_20360/g.17044 Transcript_20360/m.17044 type:complete len:97 (+) Transcript_20360:274-564(+)